MSSHGPVLSVHGGGGGNHLGSGRDSPMSECYQDNEYVGESDMEPEPHRQDCASPESSVCDIDNCVTSKCMIQSICNKSGNHFERSP